MKWVKKKDYWVILGVIVITRLLFLWPVFLHPDNAIHNDTASYHAIAKNFFSVLSRSSLGNYDLVYIRYGLSSPSFLHFLKSIKGKTVIEIPTFPYNLEYKKFTGKMRLLVDKFYQNKLNGLFDLIVHFGDQKKIFGIRALPIMNALLIDDHPLSNRSFKQTQIDMIAIGKWNNWHGLDRLLKGVIKYNGNLKFNLHIIGHGPSFNKLVALIKNTKNKDRIIIHGIQEGYKLNQLYDKADLGIGSLGIHRLGLKLATPLKHREYVARGLPVVHSGDDPLLKDGISSIPVPADDSPVDIAYIVNSYFDLLNLGITKQKIRESHKDDLSWEIQIKKILAHF